MAVMSTIDIAGSRIPGLADLGALEMLLSIIPR